MFDKNWHKINIGVFKNKLAVYIDCEYVGTQDVKFRGPIKVDGEISISKMSHSKLTVPVSSISYVSEIAYARYTPAGTIRSTALLARELGAH